MKPIIFNSEFIPLILNGSKTQTRRPLKGQFLSCMKAGLGVNIDACPYGSIGDKLEVYIPIPNALPGDIDSISTEITLEITDIRVERILNISERDAKAEGVNEDNVEYYGDNPTYYNLFKALWFQIYGQESLDRNDWVWVLEFKVLEQEKG